MTSRPVLAAMMAAATIPMWAIDIHTSAGSLQSYLGELPKDTVISAITLHGDMDIRDMLALSKFKTDSIDMRDVRITDFSSRVPLHNDRFVFAANELPSYILAGYKIKHLVLPQSLLRVGEGAFLASTVESVVIPEGTTSIGDLAFRDCISLARVDLPESLTSIGFETFAGCSALEKLNLDKTGVTEIGERAFARTTSLSSLTLPPSLRSVGTLAFAGSGIVNITAQAPLYAAPFSFAEMPQLVNSYVDVIAPEQSPGVYYADPQLKVTSPLSPVPEVAYAHSGNVVTNKVTADIGSIGDYAFYAHEGEYITLMPGVTRLGTGVFDRSRSLHGIDCSELKDNIPSVCDETFAALDCPNIKLKVDKDYIEEWKQAPVWNAFEVVTDFTGIEQVSIDGYRVSYADGYVHISADEQLTYVEVCDASGMLLAAVRPGDTHASVYVGHSPSPVILVRAATSSATRTDRLMTAR